jgi:hypothetical protein
MSPLSLLLLGCISKGSGDSGGSGGAADSISLLGAGPQSTFVRASDGELAWRVDHGECRGDGGDTVCDYTALLTGRVGRRCGRCDDQTVEFSLRATAAGRVQLDSVTLTEGSGLPLDVGFDDLGIDLTPTLPADQGETYLLGASFFGPDGLTLAYADWLLLVEGDLVDDYGRVWSDCLRFRYSNSDEPGDLRLTSEATVVACEGTGVVQVEIASDTYVRQ